MSIPRRYIPRNLVFFAYLFLWELWMEIFPIKRSVCDIPCRASADKEDERAGFETFQGPIVYPSIRDSRSSHLVRESTFRSNPKKNRSTRQTRPFASRNDCYCRGSTLHDILFLVGIWSKAPVLCPSGRRVGFPGVLDGYGTPNGSRKGFRSDGDPPRCPIGSRMTCSHVLRGTGERDPFPLRSPFIRTRNRTVSMHVNTARIQGGKGADEEDGDPRVARDGMGNPMVS